jgi:hypothetical protein
VEIQSPPKIKLQKKIPLVEIVRRRRGSKEWSGSGVPVVGFHIGVEWRVVEVAMEEDIGEGRRKDLKPFPTSPSYK